MTLLLASVSQVLQVNQHGVWILSFYLISVNCCQYDFHFHLLMLFCFSGTEEIVMKILTIARDPSAPKGLSQEAFKYLYLVTKVRILLLIVN